MSRNAELAAEIEEVVLHFAERGAQLAGYVLSKHDTEGAVQLVELAERGDARMILRHARPVAETGFAAVPGPCRDLRQPMAHQTFLTSLTIEPSPSRVVMRSPGWTCAARRTTRPWASEVML